MSPTAVPECLAREALCNPRRSGHGDCKAGAGQGLDQRCHQGGWYEQNVLLAIFWGKHDLYCMLMRRVLNKLLAAMAPSRLPTRPVECWAIWETMYGGFHLRQLAGQVLAALSWSAIQARADGTTYPALKVLAGQMRRWLTIPIEQRQTLCAVCTDLPPRVVLPGDGV